MDRETGEFAKSGSVHPIDYQGMHLSSRGPLTVPRPPQGWPMLLQAGQSGRGQQFAARWADLVFTSTHSLEAAAPHYADLREQFAAAGRPADSVGILPAVLPIVGETEEVAKAKEAYFESLFEPEEQLVTLSEQANFDFAKLPYDEPLTDEGRGCDGFAIQSTDVPGSFEDFGRLVMPELRRRGLVADHASDGTTLRERLGGQPRG